MFIAKEYHVPAPGSSDFCVIVVHADCSKAASFLGKIVSSFAFMCAE